MSTVHPPAPSSTLERIREAIMHCRHAGIPVRIGDLGVAPDPESRRLDWKLTGALSVNPLGAALIAFQPPDLPGKNVFEAVALALGVELTTIAGIRDGLENRRPTVEGWDYADGYATGLQLRAELFVPPVLAVLS